MLTEGEKIQILKSATAGGAVFGAIAGGIIGGGGGAVLGAPTGPGAILTGGAGATVGAIEGTALGTAAGAAIGGVTVIVVQKAQDLISEMGKQTGKEKASDVPSWVRQQGQRPNPGESGKKFAERVLNEKYGPGNWRKGSNTEFSQIQKWGDRAFATVVGGAAAAAAQNADAAPTTKNDGCEK